MRERINYELISVAAGLALLGQCGVGLTAEPRPVMAEGKTIVLMMGGRFCEFYAKELTEALKAVKGVKAADLKSVKGHARVTHDGSVKPEALVAAVKGVKGTKMGMEWHCTAEVMK
ncbi:MAG: cation transporter [Nitrospirota bacterium]